MHPDQTHDKERCSEGIDLNNETSGKTATESTIEELKRHRIPLSQIVQESPYERHPYSNATLERARIAYQTSLQTVQNKISA